MKFLPPEEEIRAQLRELTSQTRRLRADLQGMITRRGPSDKSFSHDRRYRLKPDLVEGAPEEPPTTDPKPPAPKSRKRQPPSSRKKRR